MKKLTLSQGRFLVRYTRGIIESHFGLATPKIQKEMQNLMEEAHRVFVVLRNFPSNDLRGCMGYAESDIVLSRAMPEVALSAAVRDSRFSPIRKNDLRRILVEISILTEPRQIKVNNPVDYPKNIAIGKDGLIIQKGFSKGLLLPQFPVEMGWNPKQFLSRTCMRGGFDPDCWFKDDVMVYKFNAQIFTELEPVGNIIEKKIFQEKVRKK